MSEFGWQWAAGIFEGEGTVWLDRTWIRLSLESTDEDVVNTFQQEVGAGNISTRLRADRPRSKRSWTWSTAKRAEVERIFNEMAPYLHSRRLARAAELGLHITLRGTQ